MPYKLWRVKVVCPNPACGQHQLTGGGLHKRARQVLDIDRMYNVVTETLICTKCKASHVSWTHQRSSTIKENHSEEWLQRLARYTLSVWISSIDRGVASQITGAPSAYSCAKCKWLCLLSTARDI
ncbi:hypothetical protein QQF64_034328 [Cirrhinus molitorella]|uniref:DUF6729 domain-containing protein n=1 Tax=Cirrhinus molitorella TaxID=172907 RepID=A0ABR3L1H9_9TELE